MRTSVKQKRILLLFPGEKRYEECVFPEERTIGECVSELLTKIKPEGLSSFRYCEKTMILDGYTGQPWDADVTLKDAGLPDGHLFLVL